MTPSSNQCNSAIRSTLILSFRLCSACKSSVCINRNVMRIPVWFNGLLVMWFWTEPSNINYLMTTVHYLIQLNSHVIGPRRFGWQSPFIYKIPFLICKYCYSLEYNMLRNMTFFSRKLLWRDSHCLYVAGLVDKTRSIQIQKSVEEMQSWVYSMGCLL